MKPMPATASTHSTILDARPSRRAFLGGAAAAVAAAALPRPARAATTPIRLGMDNFAIRAFGLKVPGLIDRAAELGLDTLLVSDLDAFESFDDAHLKELRERGREKGIEIYAGTGSVCGTSKSFNPKHGTAEEHLALAIRVAAGVGSPAVRCFLGNGGDRLSDGGIERHMESLLGTLRACRSRALDAGVKIAVENHAGDMQARELASLVESAGRDFVGVNMDSGNAAWTLEDPIASLETLGPLAVCTSLRDSAIWLDESGAAMVAWTAMGDGSVDWHAYHDLYAELCPDTPFILEPISGGPRRFDYLNDPEFWKGWGEMRAKDLARFLALARKGRPYEPPPAPDVPAEERERAKQLRELERSVAYCRDELGLGLRGR